MSLGVVLTMHVLHSVGLSALFSLFDPSAACCCVCRGTVSVSMLVVVVVVVVVVGSDFLKVYNWYLGYLNVLYTLQYHYMYTWI